MHPIDSVLEEFRTHVGNAETPPHVPGFLTTVRDVLSPQECADIIRIAEETGFVRASIYTDATGKEHFSDNRKSSRCIIDSPAFVERLWRRLEPHIPKRWNTATCVGINERLRILRYDPGDEFKPHQDGAYTAPSGAISKITILIYLNADYDGAWTHFLHENQHEWVPVCPYVGSVAMQDQSLVHYVPPLQTGRKYAIRTEVMYMPEYTRGPYKEITISY